MDKQDYEFMLIFCLCVAIAVSVFACYTPIGA
jgi:hypothetical protein